MGTRKSSGRRHGGSAGHQGHDRQPVKNGVQSSERNPEPEEAARPVEVAERSDEASEMNLKAVDGQDFNHPGPARLEAEKSKGNAHHDQHEIEPDMHKKVEGL
jgi:hypothetical protein